jgi:GNAT superfamily N-acetyltransferase
MITYRRTSPEDAVGLTELTIASKAHWGYDQDFMERARSSLTVTREYLAANDCWVAELDSGAIGWFSLVAVPEGRLLDHFWLLPVHIGIGLGRQMWQQALSRATAMGAERLILEADPNAAGFYECMGARRIGSVTAQSTGRQLPLYEVLLTGTERPGQEKIA